jgi:hypothetical protein
VKRRLFNLAAAVSLVLCLAVVTLWVRSYWRWDSVARYPYRAESRTYHQQSFDSVLGTLYVIWREEKLDPGPAAEMAYNRTLGLYGETWRYSRHGLSGALRRGPNFWERMGFDFARAGAEKTRNGNLVSAVVIRVPHWLLVALLAPMPVIYYVRRARNRHRTAQGLCLTCGYDLRASPDRCPECGTECATSDRSLASH